MNPNILYPHPDANSSSLAYLDHPLPGTNPDEKANPPINPPPPPPQLYNRAHPQRAPLRPEPDLMDVDTGTDTSHDTSPDHAPASGRKHARPETDEAEALEHSEPVCKQRRTDSPEPAAPAIGLSAEAIQNELLQAVTQGKLDRLQSLMNQIEHIDNIFDGNLWQVAARHGHRAVIEWLHKQADRLDLPKPEYIKLFETAAGHGQIDVMQWLSRQGFVIREVNNHGNNALTLAAQAGHLEVVKYLAKQGCNVHQVSKYGNNAVNFAAIAGHLDMVKWLAGQGCNIHQLDNYGANALLLAAKVGHFEIVKWLVGQGCNIHQVTHGSDSVLVIAAYAGHLDMVKWLAGQGCSIHQVTIPNENALTFAARAGHLEVVKYLAEHGCNIHQVNDSGDNALTLAAVAGHLEVVKYLAEHGCNIHQVRYFSGDALRLAALAGHLEVVKYLAGQGCPIHKVTDFEENALTLAAQAGHLEVMKWLAGQGCNAHQLNISGDNALALAAQAGHLEAVKWLAEKGLNINQINSYGYTALALSMRSGHGDVAHDLIMRGANLTIGPPPDPDGYLFSALASGNTALINALLPLHDVSQRSDSGSTPLMTAASKKLIEVAVPLIQATLQVPDGRALVHEALQIDTDPLFKELLKNPTIIDNDPLSYSRLSPEGEPVIESALVLDYFLLHSAKLQNLQDQIGFEKLMTPMQMKSAQIGILAELPAWKLTHRIEKIFNKKLTLSLLPIQQRVATFISDDIGVLATQANAWEENHLVPVIENLYPSCLMHSLSAHPAINIISELTNKGMYYPVALRIANAWTKVWATMSDEAKSLLQPTSVARNIDRFIDTSVGSKLLQGFCVALKNEFDSVESRILYVDDANLPPESKNLYADLIMRQLHLVAQFWRVGSS